MGQPPRGFTEQEWETAVDWIHRRADKKPRLRRWLIGDGWMWECFGVAGSCVAPSAVRAYCRYVLMAGGEVWL